MPASAQSATIVEDSKRHGRECLAQIETEQFIAADISCRAAAEDFATMAAFLQPGENHDVDKMMEAVYLGRVGMAAKGVGDRERSIRFVLKMSSILTALRDHSASQLVRRWAKKTLDEYPKELSAIPLGER